jgi:hypothetical protein
LIEIHDKNDIVAQAGNAVGGWHFDYEREQIVYESVEGLPGNK